MRTLSRVKIKKFMITFKSFQHRFEPHFVFSYCYFDASWVSFFFCAYNCCIHARIVQNQIVFVTLAVDLGYNQTPWKVISGITFLCIDIFQINIMFLTHISCLLQLRDGSTHEGTVTSMEPNEDTFILHNEKTRVTF